uniref:Uncharacterized protein n=1 Tax=Zea mays TaxID=4577 RepID=B6SUX9_MAIZE|nr:hypothetical protein [Zea mays]|eukprot:NP_001158964.1 uncharacterized protein LOC100303911 [Zea mays]
MDARSFLKSFPWPAFLPVFPRVCSLCSPWLTTRLLCARPAFSPRAARPNVELGPILCSSLVPAFLPLCSASAHPAPWSLCARVARSSGCNLPCSPACRASLPWLPWDLLSTLRRCLLWRLALEISPCATMSLS